MGIPHRLNGYPVRAIAYRGAGSYYVMIQRDDHPYHPWVYATWVGDKGWEWGHYFTTRDDLLAATPDIGWLDRKTLKPTPKPEPDHLISERFPFE